MDQYLYELPAGASSNAAELVTEEGRAGPHSGGKQGPEPPILVLQPGGENIACAVRLADVTQHGGTKRGGN